MSYIYTHFFFFVGTTILLDIWIHPPLDRGPLKLGEAHLVVVSKVNPDKPGRKLHMPMDLGSLAADQTQPWEAEPFCRMHWVGEPVSPLRLGTNFMSELREREEREECQAKVLHPTKKSCSSSTPCTSK